MKQISKESLAIAQKALSGTLDLLFKSNPSVAWVARNIKLCIRYYRAAH